MYILPLIAKANIVHECDQPVSIIIKAFAALFSFVIDVESDYFIERLQSTY